MSEEIQWKVIKGDARVWCAVLLLIIGVFLMDRAFAFWRNDGRNFRKADGQYWPSEDPAEKDTFFENHSVLKAMALAGSGMFVVSVLLFTKQEAGRPSPSHKAQA